MLTNRREAEIAPSVESVPTVSFETFMGAFQWKQGQHLAIIGPTDSGKTTLAHALLPVQPYVTVFATKPRDSSMDRLAGEQKYLADILSKRDGYRIFPKWPDSWPTNNPARFPHRIIWPPINRLDEETTAKQKAVFSDAMAEIYGEGSWCLYLDELYYIVQQLGMGREVKMYLLQARSLKISLAVATQRPYWVPVEVYDQSTHLFFFRDNDERNLSRIGGISWRSADLIRKLVSNLGPHEFLYVHTGTGGLVKSKVGRKV